ncbi:hypothetical protein [Marinobacter sp. ANT_B65]|uniref:hypothetical protein n=1 Tax=Marinobacter sp. ANT_B65 TaxID=2039467 RepID=UPI00117DDA4B|nr:hypothetical protein [Marinobacter sp. ANT_B65]
MPLWTLTVFARVTKCWGKSWGSFDLYVSAQSIGFSVEVLNQYRHSLLRIPELPLRGPQASIFPETVVGRYNPSPKDIHMAEINLARVRADEKPPFPDLTGQDIETFKIVNHI